MLMQPSPAAPTGFAIPPIGARSVFVPSSISLLAGTLSAGTVTSVQTMMETSGVYTITEVTGTPGFAFNFNFMDITRQPKYLVAKLAYDGSTSHFCTINLYSYTATSFYAISSFSTTGNFQKFYTMMLPLDLSPYYVNQRMIIRIVHESAGNASHSISVDYIALIAEA